MKITNFKKIPSKDMIVFDLDGTLAKTKAPMERSTAALIARLLAKKRVAVISGGKYGQFRLQLLRRLTLSKELSSRLFLFPTTGTSFYRYRNGWKSVYELRLTPRECMQIKKAFRQVLREVGYRPEKTYGPVVENRGTQITYSALGNEVVKMLGTKRGVALKEKWKREHTPLKLEITKKMAKLLPNLEVRAAGATSVDVTRKGIDKAYGLRQMEKYLHVKIKNMLFVGDAIYPHGNDYAVVRTGVDYVPVDGPEETEQVIRAVLQAEE